MRTLIFISVFALVGCTTQFRINVPLERHDPDYGYRLKDIAAPDRSEELLLILTFSGGGTRAAALSYGVLSELARTRIALQGRERRLLDEVDMISSVSGGSFTAAYYGLFGDRIFEDFESRFLKRNFDKGLGLQLLNPANWARLVSAGFSRGDMVARYYDKHLFEGRTFDDIAARGGPALLINATDIILGAQFEFSQTQFDWICSDLSKFPVARAVAASAAVPVLFTAITLRNYAGQCGFTAPPWFVDALQSREVSTRRFQRADGLASYLDVTERPYIHLLDGGLADNLGLRSALDQVLLAGSAWDVLRTVGLERTRKIVFIVVNAEAEVPTQWSQRKRAPKISGILNAATTTTVSRYNFETLELLRQNATRWAQDIRSKRCLQASGAAASACADIKFYLVEINFDALKNEEERSFLKGTSTSFRLPAEVVNRLQNAGAQLLVQSDVYQQLLRDRSQTQAQ